MITLSELNISSDPNSLLISWLQSVRLIFFNKKELRPFWNDQCQDISDQLWFPTPHLPSYNSNISCLEHSYSLQNDDSTFSVQKIKNPNIHSFDHVNSFFTPDSIWENEGIRIRKFRIHPTQEQSQILLRWLGTSRYVYNRILANVKKLI